jgi:hypothetical protein
VREMTGNEFPTFIHPSSILECSLFRDMEVHHRVPLSKKWARGYTAIHRKFNEQLRLRATIPY